VSQGTKKSASNIDTGFDPSRSTSSAKFGTAGVALKSTQGRLYRLDVVNASATAYFVMVFSKATAPVNGDAPIWRRRLPASGEVSIALEEFGLYCAAGIGIAISSTDGTLTLAAATDAHYAAQWK
jgi:hypothetical protein